MTSPIESTMTCEQLADALPEFLEREVDESTRVRVEAHATSCAECGALLADLRTLRVDAADLPPLAPSRDLWAGIAARIETPVVEIVPGRGPVDRWTGGRVDRSAGSPVEPRRRLSPMWTGLAAAGIVAITASVTHEITKRTIVVSAPATTMAATPPASSPSASAPPASTPSTGQPVSRPTSLSVDSTGQPVNRPTVQPGTLVANKRSAEETYAGEIKRLRLIVSARRTSLDTTTIRVIDQNLKVIDDAIAQCRAALERDPASRFLLQSLNDALDTKIQLLRTAATMPSRS